MKEHEILENINEAVELYDNMNLIDVRKQSDVLRKLTTNLFYLESFRVDASNKWHSVYFNSAGKTNAAKEREADNNVKELYMYRRIMTSASKVVDSIRSTISVYKNEL